MENEEVMDPIENGDDTPAIVIRKVDVIIQNGDDEESIIIKAEEQPDSEEIE